MPDRRQCSAVYVWVRGAAVPRLRLSDLRMHRAFRTGTQEQCNIAVKPWQHRTTRAAVQADETAVEGPPASVPGP